MNFDMIILNQNIKTMQNYVIWTLTALLFILKLKNFINIVIANDAKNKYDTSNYEVDRPLPKGMNKKSHRLNKSIGLGGKIITEFVALGPKTYYYSTDNDKNVKNAKGTKKRVIKNT